jgi:hypothetical protein
MEQNRKLEENPHIYIQLILIKVLRIYILIVENMVFSINSVQKTG